MRIHRVIETLAESGLAKRTLARLIETLVIEDSEQRATQIKEDTNNKILRLCHKHGVTAELEEYRDEQRITQLEYNREFPYVEYHSE